MLEKLTARRAIELLMEQDADPVGVLVAVRGVFQGHAESAELDDNVCRAYADAVIHLGRAMDEFTRRGIR